MTATIDYNNTTELDNRIWKCKEDYNFDVNRLAAALLWEKEKAEEVARRIQGRIADAKVEGLNTWQETFVQQLMSYDEGCEDGKFRFLRYLGIDPPTVTYRVVMDLECRADIDIHDVCADLENRIQKSVDEGSKIEDDRVRD